MLFDLPLAELEKYAPAVEPPADFDAFWQRSLAEAEAHPLAAAFVPQTDAFYRLVRVSDVTFAGWGGQPIRAWLLEPAQSTGRLPALVTYVGYGGGRGLPIEHLAPAVAGLVHLVMDTRGQGSAWAPGDTPDDAGSDPQYPGFMTRGVLSPDTYYYRRVIVDAVRALAAARAHPRVDPERVAVGGASQGGGLALAVAGLARSAVKLLLADVPFLCHFRRAVEMTDEMPYNEVARYLKVHRHHADRVFQTLSYFDGVHFAPRVTARSLFSVGLMDLVCPPSTVYAAFNRIPVTKEMRVYRYNQHEGGGPFQAVERLRLAVEHL